MSSIYAIDTLSELGGRETAVAVLTQMSFSDVKFTSEVRQLCLAPESFVVIFSSTTSSGFGV